MPQGNPFCVVGAGAYAAAGEPTSDGTSGRPRKVQGAILAEAATGRGHLTRRSESRWSVCLVDQLDDVLDLGRQARATDAAFELHHAARVGGDDGLGVGLRDVAHLVVEDLRRHTPL